VTDADLASMRADVCRSLADQLESVADLANQLGLDGWARHFRRDAELLLLRAQREEAPPELPELPELPQ